MTAPEGTSTAYNTANTTIFEEYFTDCAGSGGNDGKWSGSIASSELKADNTGWTFTKGNGANECAKFGTGSAKGSATTPALGTAGTLYLSFKAGAWNANNEGTTLNLSVSSGNIDTENVTLTKGEFNTFTATITNATVATTITFEAQNASNNRFFLDDVVVTATPAPIAVTLNSNGYATYCSQYPLDFSDYETADYSAWQINEVSSAGVITFSQITGSIKGGEGILLKGEADATLTLNSVASTNTLSDNLLEGTLAPTYVDANEYYGLSGNTFVKIKAGTVPAGKAILDADFVPSSARLTFAFADETTGIATVKNVTEDSSVYNLNGQRISAPSKGLYIKNGKKVFINK